MSRIFFFKRHFVSRHVVVALVEIESIKNHLPLHIHHGQTMLREESQPVTKDSRGTTKGRIAFKMNVPNRQISQTKSYPSICPRVSMLMQNNNVRNEDRIPVTSGPQRRIVDQPRSIPSPNRQDTRRGMGKNYKIHSISEPRHLQMVPGISSAIHCGTIWHINSDASTSL